MVDRVNKQSVLTFSIIILIAAAGIFGWTELSFGSRIVRSYSMMISQPEAGTAPEHNHDNTDHSGADAKERPQINTGAALNVLCYLSIFTVTAAAAGAVSSGAAAYRKKKLQKKLSRLGILRQNN